MGEGVALGRQGELLGGAPQQPQAVSALGLVVAAR